MAFRSKMTLLNESQTTSARPPPVRVALTASTSELPSARAALTANAGEWASTDPTLTTLHHALERARDWGDLEQVLAQAQAGYEAGYLTQAEVETLAQQAAIRSRSLPEKSTLCEEPAPLHLRDLLKQKPLHQVRSQVLGEDVLFAADDAQIPPDNTLVVYRESELRQLVGRSPEEIRRIHMVKKAFDGEVIAPEAGGILIDPVRLLGPAGPAKQGYASGICSGVTLDNHA